MKAFAGFVILSVVIPGFAPRAGADEGASDLAWKAYASVPKEYPPGLPAGQRESFWIENWYKRAAPAALKFAEDYPGDPRRWEAVDYYAGIILNGPSQPGERLKALELVGQMMASKDAPAKLQEHSGFTALRFQLNPEANPEILKANLAGVTGSLDDYARRFPQSPWLFFVEKEYVGVLLKRDPAAAEAKLRELASNANPKTVEMAEGMLREVEAGRKPFDLAFTAVDGREVDVAKLRGKVVLIDFWATWCEPCKEELPNVKAVYEKYHDKGFDVVGISLDGDKAREKLIDFCRDHGMPWPQYYDGKAWANDVAVKYAISSIPATFLLGRDGRIVSTEARGDRLEPEVRRQLGL
jgi:thiol-disulfide isomerase/thioredoxin